MLTSLQRFGNAIATSASRQRNGGGVFDWKNASFRRQGGGAREAGLGLAQYDRVRPSHAHPDGLRPLAGFGFLRARPRLPARRPFRDDRFRQHLLRAGLAPSAAARRPQASAAAHRARLQRRADPQRQRIAAAFAFRLQGAAGRARSDRGGQTRRRAGRLWWPDVSFFAHGPSIPRAVPHYDWIFTTKSFGLADLEGEIRDE